LILEARRKRKALDFSRSRTRTLFRTLLFLVRFPNMRAAITDAEQRPSGSYCPVFEAHAGLVTRAEV
jgi:hypothetical protein